MLVLPEPVKGNMSVDVRIATRDSEKTKGSDVYYWEEGIEDQIPFYVCNVGEQLRPA